jgi:hypothetical protein
MYTEAFKALFPDAKRMQADQIGDIVFTVDKVEIEAEFKLTRPRCYMDTATKKSISKSIPGFFYFISEKS